MKTYIPYIIIGIILIVTGIFFGWQIAGGLAIGAGGLKEAKDRINKAGDDIEKETFDDADDAAHYIDDILTIISEE